jgi:hypothetical protein
MRVRRGDIKVSGRRLAGVHGGSRFAQANVPTRTLDSLAPEPRDDTFSARGTALVTVLATRTSATDPTRVHPCVTMKGLSGSTLFTGGSRSVRKRAREARSERRINRRSAGLVTDPRSRCEDSRVRECDLITCCVASPPRCPSDRHRPHPSRVRKQAGGNHRGSRGAPWSQPGDAKGEGTSGRGSSVSFTRCEVSRSWLDGSSEERQGCQTWLEHLRLDGKTTPVRARAGTTEARNGVVKRRPHRSSLRKG